MYQALIIYIKTVQTYIDIISQDSTTFYIDDRQYIYDNTTFSPIHRCNLAVTFRWKSGTKVAAISLTHIHPVYVKILVRSRCS